MKIRRPSSFKRQLDRLVEHAKAGDADAVLMARYIHAQLEALQEISAEPVEDSALIKRVRQSGRYPVWRLSHAYDRRVAVRTICWFDPDTEEIVVALFAADKASMGDVFYDSVGSRADRVIEEWKREKKGEAP